MRIPLLHLILALTCVVAQVRDVSGAIYFSRSSGDWNNVNTWSTTGYAGAAAASVPGSAVGDVVMISGYSVSVTASPANSITSLIISQNNNTGNDTRLYIGTGGVTLTCNALSVTDNNRNNNVDVEIADGLLQINGSASIARTTSNAQDDRVRLYIYGNGRMNVSLNLSYTLNRAANNISAGNEIELSGSGRLDVGGSVNLVCGNTNGSNNVLDFQMNDTSQCNIGGNIALTVSNTDDSDDIIIDLNGGLLNVAGSLNSTTAATATNNNCIYILLDGGSMTSGPVTFNHIGGAGGDIELKLNSASTASASVLTVNGDLSYIHDGGDNMELETNANSVVNVTGNILFDMNASNDGDLFYVDLNGGQVNANGVIISVDTGATYQNSVLMNFDNAEFNINGDFIVSQAGGSTGDVNLMFNQTSSGPCSLTVAGDFLFNHTEGDNYEIELNANAVLTIQGNFIDTLISSDGDDFYIDIKGGSLIIEQNFIHYASTVSGTTEDLNIRIDDAGVFSILGNAEIYNGAGGQVSLYLNYNTGTTAQFSVSGNMTMVNYNIGDGIFIDVDDSAAFTVDGDLAMINHAAAGDIVRFRSKSASTVNIGGNFEMTLDSGLTSVNDNIHLDIDGGTMTVAGNLNMLSSGGNDAVITVDGNSTLNVGGEIKLDNTGGDLSYLYIGNSAGAPLVNTSQLSLIDGGGGQTRCRLWNASELIVNGDIIMEAAASTQVDMALYTNSKLTIRGNFVRNASRYGILSTAITSTIEFAGTAPQILPGNTGGGTDGFTFGNVIFNNAAGFFTSPAEGNVTLPANAAINFTSGIIYTSSSALLILSSGSTVTGANDASHVDGPIRKIGNQSFVFPIGDNGNYQPAAISAPSNAAHHFTAQYIAEDPATLYDDNSLDASIDHISGCEYWWVNRTNGTSNVTVTLSWDGASCGVDDLSSLRVVRWDGSAWRDHGNGGTTGNTSSGSVINSATVSSYLSPNSPFTIASINSSNPLPVELMQFTVTPLEDAVKVAWATASEKDNDFFTVERSSSNSAFTPVNVVDGRGTSHTISDYQWLDANPLMGYSYYRLKQTDLNGDFSYSDVKVVYYGGKRTTFYPNPVCGNQLKIASSSGGTKKVCLYSLEGSLISSFEKREESDGYFSVEIPEHVSNGIYMILVDDGLQLVTERIVIQRN